jgi:MFS family permease
MSFRWKMVAVAVLGLIVGPGPINIFAFSVFLKPITADLGVTRELMSFALVFATSMSAITNPFIGASIDRFGTRPTLLAIIPIYALGIVGYSFFTAWPAQIIVTCAFVGLVGTITGPTGYAALVARWFDRERGLALGIAMAGVGLGAALVPPAATVLIAHFGWRWAYRGIAIGMILLAWVPAWFIRDPGPGDLAKLSDARPDGTLAGLGVIEAMKTWAFWALTLAFFLGVAGINGVVAHTVPMLTDRGISVALATTAVSISGICIIFGRILSGWCLDRYSGRVVSVTFFVFPMLGIVLLAEGSGIVVPLVGAAMCGLAVGAEIDLMAYFVSRYFGVRHYGRVYGFVFILFAVGNGVGPFIGGVSFTRFGGYGPALIAFEIMLVVTCGLFMTLGPYPYPAPKRHRETGMAKAAA